MMALIKEDSPSDIVSIPSIDDDSSIAMIIEMEKEERELFYSIDVLTIPSKIAFFFSGCIFGSHLPYINIFLVSIGLSTSQAGIINGIRFIISFVFHPMLGAFVDHTGKRIFTAVVLLLGVAISSSSIPLSAYFASYNKTEIYTNQTGTATSPPTNNGGLFFIMLISISIASMFIIPHAGYIDTTVINLTKLKGRNFGRQKMFYSVGFSFCSFLSGLCVDYFYYQGFSRYTVTFIINATASLSLLPVACYLISQVDRNEEQKPIKNLDTDSENSDEIGSLKVKMVLDAFRSMDMIVFTINVLVSSIAHSTYIDFTFLLTKDIIKSKASVSLLVSMSSASSIFGFLVSTKLIKAAKNTTIIYVLSSFAYCIRFVVMSSVETYWIILLVQPLHGFCFAVTWTAILSDIQKNTASGINTTIHSIEQAIFLSLGPLLTNVIGGKLFHRFGGQLFFRGVGIFCVVWGIIMTLYEVRRSRNSKRKYDKDRESDLEKKKLNVE